MYMYDHQYDVGVQCRKGSRGVYHYVEQDGIYSFFCIGVS